MACLEEWAKSYLAKEYHNREILWQDGHGIAEVLFNIDKEWFCRIRYLKIDY